MERKKAAILLPWLKMGGTNKVALRFIKELSQYCDVTLILSQDTGELKKEIPQGTKVIIDHMADFHDLVKKDLKSFNIPYLFKDVQYYSTIKRGKDSIDNYKYIVDRTPMITDEEFDIAVSYHGQSPERLLNLLYRIKAKKKVAWIHGQMAFPLDQMRRLNAYYQQLDHFFFVSGPTRDSFLKWFPMSLDKTTVYYNPLNKQEIVEESAQPLDIPYPEDVTKLLTVGRISSEKGQDMIPAITKNLIDDGYKICWFVIGNGPAEESLKEQIVKEHVEQEVRLLGVKNNPYCYMKACDIYVQPSYTEGYSTTICEAGILGKPIIGTIPSGGIKDQIIDGVDGLIVGADVKSLTNAIEKLIDHSELRKQFSENILKKDFEGKGEIQKFLRVMED